MCVCAYIVSFWNQNGARANIVSSRPRKKRLTFSNLLPYIKPPLRLINPLKSSRLVEFDGLRHGYNKLTDDVAAQVYSVEGVES